MIITANNRTTTDDYPYYLSFSQTPYRADRLRELLQGRDDWSPEDMPEIQSDQTSLHARFIAERVSQASVGDEAAAQMQSLLVDWDGHMAIDSAAALVYYEFCEQLIALTVRAVLQRASADRAEFVRGDAHPSRTDEGGQFIDAAGGQVVG